MAYQTPINIAGAKTLVKEALEAAAVIIPAFQEALQEIADTATTDHKYKVSLSIEIASENLLDLIETANKEDIATMKTEKTIS